MAWWFPLPGCDVLLSTSLGIEEVRVPEFEHYFLHQHRFNLCDQLSVRVSMAGRPASGLHRPVTT